MPITVPYPATAADYGIWLAKRAPWQLFVSLTLADKGFGMSTAGATHIGVAGAERFLRRWFRESVRSRGFAYGTRPYGAFAMEQHKDRVTPHFHGTIGGLPEWIVHDVEYGRLHRDRSLSYLWREWFTEHGHARMERITESLSVASYVSKYVTKGGGKLYALGSWPQVSEYDEPRAGDEDYERWEAGPGSRNAERMWREMCETL